LFLESSEEVEIKEKILLCRDEKDNIILETAVVANANIIITGDKDLLILEEFRNIKILSPQEFTKIYNF
jgi:uncharacterized protein